MPMFIMVSYGSFEIRNLDGYIPETYGSHVLRFSYPTTICSHDTVVHIRRPAGGTRGRTVTPLLQSLVEAERSPSHVPIRSVFGGGDQKKAMGGRLLLLASWEMVSVVDVSGGGCGWWVVRRTFS